MPEEESETLCSMSLTDEVELSFDGKWLRKYFKLPLKMGIKEIVARKPCDPVTYLGFWLLNYRRCQECKQWQLEKDNELNYLRSMIEEPVCIISRVLCLIGFNFLLFFLHMSYLNVNKILMCNKLNKYYIYWITDFYAFVVQKYTERMYLIINICSLITIFLFSIIINKNIFRFWARKRS